VFFEYFYRKAILKGECMELKQIDFRNFLVFKEMQTIKFDNLSYPLLLKGINKLEFNKINENIQYGSNGSGKTSFLNLFPFIFFNYSDKSSLDDLINSSSKKDLYVRAVVEKDGEIFTIFKFRKNKFYQNKTFLFKGDIHYDNLAQELENQPQKMPNEVCDYIESFFFNNINVKAFFNTYFFSQKDLANFFEKNTTEKYKVFQFLFKDFSQFDKIKKLVQEKSKESEKKLIELNSKYSSLFSVKQDIEQDLKNLTEVLKQKEKEKKDKIQKFKELLNDSNKIKDLEELKNFFVLQEKKENEYQQKINNLNLQVINTEKELNKIKNEDVSDERKNRILNYKKLEDSKQLIKNEIQEIEKKIYEEKNKIMQQKAEIEKKLRDKEDEKNAVCLEKEKSNAQYEKILSEEKKIEVLQEKIKQNLEQLINEKQKEIDKATKTIKELEEGNSQTCYVCGQPLSKEQILYYQKRIQEINKEIEDLKAKNKEEEKKLTEAKELIKNKKTLALQEQAQIEQKIKEKETEFENFKDQVKQEFKKIEKNEEIEILENKTKELLQHLKEVEEKINSFPAEDKIDINFFEHIKVQKQELLKELQNLNEARKVEEKSFIEEKEKLNKVYKLICSKLKNVESFKSVDDVEEEIEKIKNLEKELESLKSEKIEEEILIKQKETEKNKIEQSLAEIQKVLEEERENYNNITFFEIIDEFKKFLLNSVISIFNEKLNFLLKFFFVRNIKIIFDEELNYNLEFEDQMFKNNIEVLSGGEQRRINLACNLSLFFTLRELTNADFNFLIFDEILDTNLDSLGVQAMLNIIENINSKINNMKIIVVSHKNDYDNYFQNKLYVEKKENGTSCITLKVN